MTQVFWSELRSLYKLFTPGAAALTNGAGMTLSNSIEQLNLSGVMQPSAAALTPPRGLGGGGPTTFAAAPGAGTSFLSPPAPAHRSMASSLSSIDPSTVSPLLGPLLGASSSPVFTAAGLSTTPRPLGPEERDTTGDRESMAPQARDLHSFLCCALYNYPDADVFWRLKETDDGMVDMKKCGIRIPTSGEMETSSADALNSAGDDNSVLNFDTVLKHLSTFRASFMPEDVRRHLANSIVPVYAIAIKFWRLQKQVEKTAKAPSYADSVSSKTSATADSSHTILKHLLNFTTLSWMTKNVHLQNDFSEEHHLYDFLRKYGQDALQSAAAAVLVSTSRYASFEALREDAGSSPWALIERVYNIKEFRSPDQLQHLVRSDDATVWQKTFQQNPLRLHGTSPGRRTFWVAAIQAMISLHELRAEYMVSPDKIILCGPQKCGKSFLWAEIAEQAHEDPLKRDNTRIPVQIATDIKDEKTKEVVGRVFLVDTPGYDDLVGLEERMWSFSAMTARAIIVVTTVDTINTDPTLRLLTSMFELAPPDCKILLLINQVDLLIKALLAPKPDGVPAAGPGPVRRERFAERAAREAAEAAAAADVESAAAAAAAALVLLTPGQSVAAMIHGVLDPKVAEVKRDLASKGVDLDDIKARLEVRYSVLDLPIADSMLWLEWQKDATFKGEANELNDVISWIQQQLTSTSSCTSPVSRRP